MGASLDAIWNEVQRLNEKLDALPGLIEVNGNQVKVVSLDELSETLGLIKAGEFRAGNLRAPGDSFSGTRIGYPGFYYPATSTASSDLYNIVGVDADTLQFGLRSSDGVAVFGGGFIELSDRGEIFGVSVGALNSLSWQDTSVAEMSTSIQNPGMLGQLYFTDQAGALSTEYVAGQLSAYAYGWIDTAITTPAASDMAGVVQVQIGAQDAMDGRSMYSLISMSLVASTVLEGINTPFRLETQYLTSTAGSDAQDLFLRVMNFGGLLSDPTFTFGEFPGDTNGSVPIDVSFMGPSTGPYIHFDGNAGQFILGASDTSNLSIGWLAEKAWTLASTATAGIEDPDNEMGKLWLDTDAEMRLTDTAGEDWYVTKSTSTGGAHNYSVNVFSTGNFSPATVNVYDPIPFSGERWDVGAIHDAVNAPTRLTVPTGAGGIWGVWFDVTENPRTTTTSRLRFQLSVNGANLRGIETSPGSTTAYPSASFYSEFDLNAADYVEIAIIAVTDTAEAHLGDSNATAFGMHWLRTS